MKNKLLMYSFVVAAFAFGSTGCKKLLEETPRERFAPSFFTTVDGLKGGVNGVYSSLRDHWGTQIFLQLFNSGTDETLRGAAADVQHWFTYNNPLISTASNDYLGFFGAMYTDINTLNGVLLYGVDANIPADTKTQLLAQAKFLRGFCYYYLVTTFGAVPLRTTFNTEAIAADAPAPLADIYAQIIKDLTEAAADLPNVPATGTGKPATKATALYLLSKTYLWRGWSAAAQANDFQMAYTTAKSIIDNKATYNLDLLPYFPAVFVEGNEYSREILMVIDHTRDQKFGENNPPGAGGGGGGANHSNFMWRPNYPTLNANYPASGGANVTVRDIRNGRPFQRIRPNMKYVLEQAFANRATDSRYDGTFQTVWLSNSTQVAAPGTTGATTPRGTLINAIDTSIWMADRLVTPAERAAFKGIIFEPNFLPGATVPYTPSFFPSMRKWDDSTRVDLNDYSDRPYILYRFAELYLIAAEAAIKGGATNQDAADMINVLRTRAARKNPAQQSPAQYDAAVAAQMVTAADMNIDFLLDERSREMYGEDTRWWDLSRTKKLVERVRKWNTENGINGSGVEDFNMLRPIPQSQIDLVTEGPKYPQNPGY